MVWVQSGELASSSRAHLILKFPHDIALGFERGDIGESVEKHMLQIQKLADDPTRRWDHVWKGVENSWTCKLIAIMVESQALPVLFLPKNIGDLHREEF
jgi:hypothetical protein